MAIAECGLEAAKRPTAGVATGALRCNLLPSTLGTVNKFYITFTYEVQDIGLDHKPNTKCPRTNSYIQ